MAVRLRVKEVAREKGVSMGKLHRAADVSYKTIKRIYADPFYATTTITLGKLALVLHVAPGDLIEEVVCTTPLFAPELIHSGHC